MPITAPMAPTRKFDLHRHPSQHMIDDLRPRVSQRGCWFAQRLGTRQANGDEGLSERAGSESSKKGGERDEAPPCCPSPRIRVHRVCPV